MGFSKLPNYQFFKIIFSNNTFGLYRNVAFLAKELLCVCIYLCFLDLAFVEKTMFFTNNEMFFHLHIFKLTLFTTI